MYFQKSHLEECIFERESVVEETRPLAKTLKQRLHGGHSEVEYYNPFAFPTIRAGLCLSNVLDFCLI